MSDLASAWTWAPVSAVRGFLPPGRHGRSEGPPGVRARLRDPLSIAAVIPLAGQRRACLQALSDAWGTGGFGDAPCRRVVAGPREWVWAGPDRFLVLDPSAAGDGEAVVALQRLLDGRAAVIDQSDGRFVLRLTGPAVRRTLARGVGIDLHPRVFEPDATALTQLCHLNVQLTRIGAGDTFDLVGPRAAADDLCDWLIASAAQEGLDVEA